MSNYKEILKQVLNDKINDDHESANSGIHDYIVAKLQDMAGLRTNEQKSFDE